MNVLYKQSIPKGSRIRVLVVDDSVVIRRLVTLALEEESSIEIVGTASNGAVALTKISQLRPDLITLDIEMAEMDGLQMLREMRKTYGYKDVRVIMFSTLTERGAAATFEALSNGADDYVGKASNEGSLDKSMLSLRQELIPKIKQFFELQGEVSTPQVHIAPALPQVSAKSSAKTNAQVVVLGVSTGGPSALSQIIPQFPADFPLPILIVQHMPPVFTRLLAERLQSKSALSIQEAAEGMTVRPGKVLIAPGDYHMRLAREGHEVKVKLDRGELENSCRPAVDVLFRSAAQLYGATVVATMLTGMGSDGLKGTKLLKQEGAYVIAQDEQSSVVWGMPGAVVNAGLANAVLPLSEVVPALLARCRTHLGTATVNRSESQARL